jgi:hypothetical protein
MSLDMGEEGASMCINYNCMIIIYKSVHNSNIHTLFHASEMEDKLKY